jgi:hypothetical protein
MGFVRLVYNREDWSAICFASCLGHRSWSEFGSISRRTIFKIQKIGGVSFATTRWRQCSRRNVYICSLWTRFWTRSLKLSLTTKHHSASHTYKEWLGLWIYIAVNKRKFRNGFEWNGMSRYGCGGRYHLGERYCFCHNRSITCHYS